MTDFATRRRLMVDTQVRPADVTKFPIIDALLRVPREAFVPDRLVEAAYVGENLTIGARRVVLDPRTLSKMLDALNLAPSDVVLDIGCTYGYSAAVISRLAEAVVAIDDDTDFVREAQEALTAHNADNVMVEAGDLAAGAPEHAPFDVILIQGGVEQIPAALIDQLKEGGRIAVLFMDGRLGEVRIGYKMDGGMTWRRSFNAGAPVLAGFKKQKAFAL